MLIQILRGCFAPDAGGEGDPENQREKLKPSDVLAQFGQTAEGALKMAERLAHYDNDNFALRRKNDQYKQELDALRGKVAPEGGRVISKDESALLDTYVALGKPDDLTKAVTERDAAQAELSKVQRDLSLVAAGEAHGYKVAVLGKLPSLVGKEVLLKDVTEGETTTKRAFVKDGATETGLAEYITAHDPELLPALTAETSRPAGGTPYPAQPGNGGKPAVVNAAKTYTEKTKYAIPGRKEA